MLKFLMKKEVFDRDNIMIRAISAWKCFNKSAEIALLKGEIARISMAIEDIKFQDNLLRTNFILQKNELESKIRELMV